MKRYEVLLTEDAEHDLEEIFDYVAEHDGLARATYVLDRIGEALANLATFPERGPHPKELLTLGIRELSPDLLQTVSLDLPGRRESRLRLPGCRWPA